MFLKKRKIFLIIAILSTILVFVLRELYNFYPGDNKWHAKTSDYNKLVVWWRPIGGLGAGYTATQFCGIYQCTFTTKRDEWRKAQALLFYGSTFSKVDVPLPRQPSQVWALLHEESPRNVPYASREDFLKHFNFTSTLSRHSNFPLTTLYLGDARDLTSPKHVVPVGEKTRLQHLENLAPIVFLNSDCDTLSERDVYVKELMKHISIDSYGACLNNRELPKNLKENYLNKLNSAELYMFLSKYKFILAYENGVCYDYISEKFWRPLVIGSIPIYFGAPTIKDWQPNEKSVIHIRDFQDPKDLAAYVKTLNANDTAYNEYLLHKYSQLTPITNQQLQQALLMRDYSPSASPNLMHLFECFVCQQLHENSQDQQQTANIHHYNCPYPPDIPPMNITRAGEYSDNYKIWMSIMSMGRCQAEILNELWTRNQPYSRKVYEVLQSQKVQAGACG